MKRKTRVLAKIRNLKETLKNHPEYMMRICLPEENQWCFRKSSRQFKGIPPCGGNSMALSKES
jgi:hypothetical protein